MVPRTGRGDLARAFRIRTKEEARCIIQESFLIDRGFLPNRLTLIVIFATLGLWFLAPIWSMGPIGVLALDYAWFVGRRRRVLRQYEAGRRV